MSRIVRAPTGTKLHCKGWLQEAAYRMLQNNLDPDVAGDPENLIVYGGRGRAARNWQAFEAILASLRELENDETLLVQSGKPVAVFRTHADAPRVLIANSNIVPHWATQENFDTWEAEGLIMYGQMTAGSWIYIGTQGILQGTFETFAAAAHQAGWPSLKGKWVLTAGLGEMGGAQPLAITMNGGVGLLVEVDDWRAQRRLEHRYIDEVAEDYADALRRVEHYVKSGTPRSVGLIGNAAEIFPRLLAEGHIPDMVTDQTSAHDYLAYFPHTLSIEEGRKLRDENPAQFARLSAQSMAAQCAAMVDFQKRGAIVFDYGNNLRQRAYDEKIGRAHV